MQHLLNLLYFYPRSPRGERLGVLLDGYLHTPISIHAPREGSDGLAAAPLDLRVNISIHAPREGSDNQSTSKREREEDFYPRSPRGERLGFLLIFLLITKFLSTLPARGATISPPSLGVAGGFLSTLPARGATRVRQAQAVKRPQISIHAPREGSDSTA